MKKTLACILAFILVFGTMSLCLAETTAQEEPVTLKLWWWGEEDVPGSKAWLEQSVEAYRAVKPNVTVELVQQTSDNLIPAWETSMQAGSGADIQFFWTGTYTLMYAWGEESYLADLSQYIAAEEMAHYMGTEGVTYNHKLVAVPWYQVSIVMLYNKKIFEAAGLDPNVTPANWEEFLAACESLKQHGVIPFEVGGMKDGFGTPWIYSTMGIAAHDSVAEYVNAALTEGAFVTPAHSLWLEQLSTLYEKGYINPFTMSNDFQSGRESFLRGEAAMGLATNGQAIGWIEQMGGDEVTGIMRIPAFGDGAMAGAQNVQSQAFGIPAFSQHKQEAADFIVFMHQPEQLKNFYQLTKNFPADDRFDPNALSTPSEKMLWDYLLEKSSVYPSLYLPTMVHSIGNYAACQMVLSGESPESAAQYVEDAAVQWRTMNPEEVDHFAKWAATFN